MRCHFRIVAKLHSMEVFRYCCPFQNSLQHELSLIIKVRKSKRGNSMNERRGFSRRERLNGWIE